MEIGDIKKVNTSGGIWPKKLHFRITVRNYFVNLLIIFLLSSGMTMIGLIVTDVFDMVTIRRYLGAPLLFALNTVPLLLFMLLLYHLTSRLWVSFSLGSLIFLLLEIVNSFKMTLREEPLTPADFMLGMEAAKVVKFSELPVRLFIIFSCVLFVVLSVYLFAFVKSHKLSWPLRAAGAVISAALLILSYNTCYKNTGLYNSFKINGSQYSRVNQFKSRGFVYSFLVSANTLKSFKPEGYSQEEAKELLAPYEKASSNADSKKLPNIIAVMGEAFYDIDRIPGVEFNQPYDPLKNFNRLAAQGYSGRIVTNVFGGGTENTEFAFLTGHSMSLMNNMGSPYMTYLRKDTFALPRVLEKAGYATMAFHPGDSWFYNRFNVYDFFGFDSRYFKNSMDLSKVKYYYGYISDTDTVDFILKKFDEHISEKSQSPFFQFIVTIANHGPYAKESLGNPDILKRPDNMDEAAYNTLNNYIAGLSRCDQALGYLTDSLDKMSEPVVFLFFADHLPYLGENYLGYKALDFDIGRPEDLQAFLNQYETPYFIWSNQAAKELLAENQVPLLEGKAPEISSNYLATELLKYIGLDGGAYFDFIEQCKGAVPVITDSYYKENGAFTENLSEQSKELLEQYRKIQYYMMMDKDAIGP